MAKVNAGRQGFLTKSALPTVTRSRATYSNLLLLGSGSNGSTTITDSSINNLTVTRFGSVAISTASFPTGMTSSILFNGTTDYLTVPSINLTGNFTIECFVNLTSTQANYDMLCGENLTSNGKYFSIINTGLEAQFGIVPGTLVRATQTFTPGTWYHIALVRSGTTISMYVDGQQKTVTNSTQSANFPVQTIGTGFGTGSTYMYNGYISNFRITPAALYTNNFTPPSLPMGASPPDTINGSSVLLLGSGTNGSTSILDSSPNNLTVTRVGSPVISTAEFPTGMSSSIFFPADSGNRLTVPWNSNNFSFPGDFTVDFWINFSSHGSFGGIFAAASTSTVAGFQIIFFSTTDQLFLEGGPGSLSYTVPSTLSRNVWTHVAVSRVSGTIRVFYNGNQVGSVVNSGSYLNNLSQAPIIGNERTNVAGFTGYLSNLRVLNRIGLYSANFTPPAPPLDANIITPAVSTVTNSVYGAYQNY